MKEYKIGFNMYNVIKEDKDFEGPWKHFMNYVIDENVDVIIALRGKDYLRIIYDPKAPDQIREVPIQS